MAKKVLVLCQRKTGYLESTPKRVEELITPKLETLVKNILKTEDYTIEYLSDKKGYEEGDVDILGSLKIKKTDDFTSDFLSKNKKSYSLIILNTCPFPYMPYPVIYKLLADDGLMVFSSYPNPANIKEPDLYIPSIDVFSNITTEDMDVVLYKKIPKKIPVTQSAGKLYKNKVSMKSKSKSNRCRSKNKYKNKYKNKKLTKRNCPRKINKTFKTK
jgi:hypothetical protein